MCKLLMEVRTLPLLAFLPAVAIPTLLLNSIRSTLPTVQVFLLQCSHTKWGIASASATLTIWTAAIAVALVETKGKKLPELVPYIFLARPQVRMQGRGCLLV